MLLFRRVEVMSATEEREKAKKITSGTTVVTRIFFAKKCYQNLY